MAATRKITVEVPKALLESTQAFTGKSISETVREGLELLATEHTRQEALKPRKS